MKTIKFPVVEDEERTFPLDTTGAKCPVCGLKEISNESEHVLIHGGALQLDEKTDNVVQAAHLHDNLQAFLFMDWESGQKHETNKYAELEITRDVKKGQYSILFCSTECLRSFLNTCVDELEDKIINTKNA